MLTALCGSALAQAPGVSFAPVEPETLSNSFVRCFYKDTRGFMWIGTADGLIRYDGTNAYRYEHSPDQRNSLCHNNVNAIIEDAGKRLWVATSQGVCIYNRDTDDFVTLDSMPGLRNHLNNRYVTALAFDRDGQLWMGTHEGGVNVFDPRLLRFTYLVDEQTGEAGGGNYINALLCMDDVMWCGTKGGLRLFNTREKRPLPLTIGGEPLPARQISQLVADNAGNVWLATVNGEILKVIPRNGYYTFQSIISGERMYGASWNNILTLCKDARGNLWIGGENSGLNYFDAGTDRITRYLADDRDPKQLATNSVRTIYIDDTGIIWIGTFNKGAYRIDKRSKKFERHKPYAGVADNFAGRQVRSFAEDRLGNIWITIEEVGLARIDPKSKTLDSVDGLNRQLTNKYLTAIVCDRAGRLWVGSVGTGVYSIDPLNFTVRNYALESDGFGNNKISMLYEDRTGTLWAGTLGSGLFRFDPRHDRFAILSEEQKPNHVKHTAYISAMLEDSDGTLWVATMYGLHALTRNGSGTFDYTSYLPDDRPGSITSGGIHTVYEDRNKNLWVGTTDNGLNRMAKGKKTFDVFRKRDGLASNTVRALAADAAGNLWISGNMGLTRLDAATGAFTTYSREDGLPSNNFYGNACLRSSRGELFFGGNNGFTVFSPDSIAGNGRSPKVYLSDLKINNQSVSIGTPGSPLKKHISLTSSLELSYDQRSFVIDFAALDVGQSFKPAYCYKLDGFDTNWNCPSAGHSATYTNMDPGEYVFLVKAGDGEGGWSEPPVRLQITVRPLIWKTWWAMAIYCACLVAVAYGVMRVRTEQANMKHQLTLERLAREREHELSESKTQFFTNISHEFRTPLSLILMPLESLIAEERIPPAAKDRVVSAYRSADRMMHLVNELMDFNKIESGKLDLDLQYGALIGSLKDMAAAFNDLAAKRNIRFLVKAQTPALTGWFDRDKIEKMVVNLLSNAFKFTRDHGEITVLIGEKTQIMGPGQLLTRCLELVVVDNGMGISKEEIPHIFDKFYQAKSASKVPNPGTGIGLSWTKALVELHQGRITVESIPDRETRFTIVIPIDAHAFEREGAVEVQAAVDDARRIRLNGQAELVPENMKAYNKEKPDILIVEDNDELRSYLLSELRPRFNILEACDGVEGLKLAQEKVPDLIVSDILMPNKTGTELCQAVRADVKTSHIPFILLTAKATVDDRITGIEKGADVYITKPFSIRYLAAHAQQLIESRQKLYAHFSQDVYLFPGNNQATRIEQEFLQRVIDYIVQHIQDTQLGVDSLAGLLNLSRVQVYRKIKALTGKTAVEFIRSVRLKQALKLMETKKYTLSEVAYRSGFNSASYFTRTFKEEYGKAPSEYLGLAD